MRRVMLKSLIHRATYETVVVHVSGTNAIVRVDDAVGELVATR